MSRVSQRQRRIVERLSVEYADVKPALRFRNPFELLLAVILSAQCTDTRVNVATARLFAVADTPQAIVDLGLERLAELIRDCGLWRNKAKSIMGACERLVAAYGGEVPRDYDALLTLPGVGRKTANVVSSIAFGRDAIAVDTHVFRVANRLRLAVGETPLAVEKGLQRVIPKSQWSAAHHWLIWHGRRVCKSRKPKCAVCCVRDLCPASEVQP